jgi:plasmid maintenance system antidote protein VapI
MTLSHKRAVIIDPERSVEKELKDPDHFVFRIEVAAKDRERDAFLVLKASTLNQFAESLIRDSLAAGNLRIVFVRMDTNADSFFDKVQELETPRLLQKLFRVTSAEQINRILHSWCDKRAEISIAGAYVDGDELLLQSCDLKRYRVKFADFKGLAELPKEKRTKFQIDEIGDRLYWPSDNVSIDLDVIRYRVDKEFRYAKDIAALSDYQDFLGQAIQSTMTKYGLTQAALAERGGPTARHLYRIARGQQRLTSAMIDKIANAHGLLSEEYIAELVHTCDELAEQAAER